MKAIKSFSLNGIVYQKQPRTCGKPTCTRCSDGQGHGPYWYAFWREGSRTRSKYLGKQLPAAVEYYNPEPDDLGDQREPTNTLTELLTAYPHAPEKCPQCKATGTMIPTAAVGKIKGYECNRCGAWQGLLPLNV